MIDAKSLRVGNWVSVNGVNIKVESIVEDDGINQSIEGDYYGGWITEYEGRFHDWQKNGKNVVNGIELTGELLIKCGFEKGVVVIKSNKEVEECYWLGSVFVLIREDQNIFIGKAFNDSDFKNNVWCTIIFYLHELQNGYYFLTNKELEVNL